MSKSQISFLEKELVKLTTEINRISASNTSEKLTHLKEEYATVKNTLGKLRIQEFENREYLDFDDDLR
jgi:hypothetical protein